MNRYFQTTYVYSFIFVFLISAMQVLRGQVVDSLMLVDQIVINFESGSSEIGQEANKLDDIDVPDSSLVYRLTGHTDLVGSAVFNTKLAQRRVARVKEYLITKGVDYVSIDTNAKGERDPTINTLSDEVINRRVEIEIFKPIEFRWISGRIEDEETKNGIIAKVIVKGKTLLDSVVTSSRGEFRLLVPDNTNYLLTILSDEYFYKEKLIKVSKLTTKEFKVSLPPVRVGSVFDLPNFNFRPGSDILMPTSVPRLDLLYKSIRNNNRCIEIKGHVNRPNAGRSPIGSSDHELSVNRAKVVRLAMIDKGINPKRLLSNGYSNWEMLHPLARSERRQAENRRVEILVIDCVSMSDSK